MANGRGRLTSQMTLKRIRLSAAPPQLMIWPGSAMTESPSSPPAEPGDRLLIALRRILGCSMGAESVSLPFSGRILSHPLGLLAIYASLWAAAEAATWALGWEHHQKILVGLLAWAAWYITSTAYFARAATDRILATVERDLIPNSPPSYLDAVAFDLERRATNPRAVAPQLLTAALLSAAGAWAIVVDLKIQFVWTPQMLFGLGVMFLRFVVAARMTAAARFYLSFAEHLDELDGRAFYVLRTADSPLVRALAKVANQVLIFWVLTFLAILPVLLVALPWLDNYSLPPASLFLMFFIPATGFLSVGMGSLVYLRSEADVRAAVARFTQRQAAALQKKADALFDPLSGRMPGDPEELERLIEWQDRVLAGGRYGSRFGTTISVALPFLLPAASLIKALIWD
jgi:hypothetical protein